MSQENVEIIRRVLQAASCGDVAAAKDLTGPDIQLDSVFGSVEGGWYQGHSGIERWFADVADTWEMFEQTPERFIEIDQQRTIALTRVRGKGRGSGIEIGEHTASIWTVRDGRVVGIETHRSLDEALEAAGLSE